MVTILERVLLLLHAFFFVDWGGEGPHYSYLFRRLHLGSQKR